MTQPPRGTGGMTGDPKAILGRAQGDSALRLLAEKIRQPTAPIGTPYAKIRMGTIVSVDATNWTCEALVGEMTNTVSGIPMIGDISPGLYSMGIFTQVDNEYTLIGVLQRDQFDGHRGASSYRIRKQVDQVRTATTTVAADDELKFYGMAGRSYIIEAGLVVQQDGSSLVPDFKMGFVLPAGASWTGGGPGPAVSMTVPPGLPSDPTPTDGQANWRALVSAASGTLSFGLNGNVGQPTLVLVHASIRMDVTGGLCSLAWAQNASAGVGTVVKAGSWLKADITSEITA